MRGVWQDGMVWVVGIRQKNSRQNTDNQNTVVQIGVRILNLIRALGIPKGRRIA
jgi:hypothetical protein